ncbi:hypothetical protein SAMN04488112_10893 [Melghirimyces thermohalophilus]|uniref:Uncharacterized protein n=1 Tax=Melghirimyces thermohalophilus TaxID=1236220 RepID=A0A1G6LSY6_9BACL|nr:hypothetical protein [Melghirimyces thermohalophilus]SDC45796.1 hypothetical protein SAMN04488112_10893 [Melghirimyces thermohalophilus]
MEGLARRLFASVFISLMAAALLSLLPTLDRQSGAGGETPVFGPMKERVVTDENLADFLLQQPIQLRVVHVEWDQGGVRLDMQQSEGTEAALYQDLLTLLKGFLVRTSNVASVELNAVAANHGTKVTVYAKRSDISQDPGMKQAESMSAQAYLKRTFHTVRHPGRAE